MIHYLGLALPAVAEEYQLSQEAVAESIRDYARPEVYRYSDPRMTDCHYCHTDTHPTQKTATVRGEDGDTAVSILSLEEAQKLFDEIRNGELGKGIDFNFIKEGCFARAQLLSYRLRMRGIQTAKLFLTNNSGAFYQNGAQAEYYTWGYHVAPAIYVRDGGQIKMMVIDPTLMGQVAPVSSWVRKQNSYPPYTFDNLYLTSPSVYQLTKDAKVPTGQPPGYMYMTNTLKAEKLLREEYRNP